MGARRRVGDGRRPDDPRNGRDPRSLHGGARISNATTITDAMLRAAAIGVADQSPCRSGASAEGVLPALDQVQAVSKRIALAVAQAARAEGVGDNVADSELERRLDRVWWTPVYQPFGEEALR